MKKQNFLTMALIAAILGLASCGGNYKAKKANLSTQEDSLNYALGLAISEELRMNALQNDSSEKSIAALVEKIEKVLIKTINILIKNNLINDAFTIKETYPLKTQNGLLCIITKRIIFDRKASHLNIFLN